MITAVTVPGGDAARNSHYLKLRDRASFEFALVSAAVGHGRCATASCRTCESPPVASARDHGACRTWKRRCAASGWTTARCAKRRRVPADRGATGDAERLQADPVAARGAACVADGFGLTEAPMAYIGQGIDRVDGRLKVTGGARYAAEFRVPDAVHAVLVQSTVGAGAHHGLRSCGGACDAGRAGDHHAGKRAEAAYRRRLATDRARAAAAGHGCALQRTACSGRGGTDAGAGECRGSQGARAVSARRAGHVDGCGARSGLPAEALPQRRTAAGFTPRRSGQRL